MEFRILETSYGGRIFKIEEDYPEIGSYLYIYENEKCVKDYLQNDIGTCKQIALKYYGVPLNKWTSKEKK